MPKAKATQGVCAACKYDPDCIYSSGPDRVFLQCEQFEMGTPVSEEASLRAVRELERMVGIHSAGDAALPAVLGLCVNCDHRESCTYPKPEGGVWRCEEYQ